MIWRTDASNELVRQTLRTVELFRPAVWSMENPVGRIARLNDLPDARLTFQPNLYGDPYTKKTLLWGNFNTDLPQAPVEDTEGSKMHKMSSGNKYGRSLTPDGFAYAFFVANNAAGMAPAARLAQEFHGIKANEFAPALERMSEADIRSMIQDRYYDGNLDAVRSLLASGQPRRPAAGEQDPRNAKDAGYAPRRSKAKDEDGQIRAAIARVPGFDGPQTDALAKWIGARPDSARIVANLHQHAGTPWAKQSLQGALTRAAIEEYAAGRKPAFDSFLNAPSAKGLHAMLESQGAAGAWAYLEREGLVGGSSKPVNSVSSSFIDCNPSSDCAKFCYAARGNFAFGASVRKSELVTWAVEQDPVRVGRMMAGEYSATLEFQHQKALRLFDKGDGTTPWVKVIETLNAHVGPDGKSAPIRVQVFSKNPEFLRQVPAMNLRMLSADKSNEGVVRANPDLPVAFVYSDASQVEFLTEIKDRVQVILPVKLGVKILEQAKIDALPRWTKPVVCPIDDGRVKIGKNQFQRTDDGSKLITQPGEWNCTRCDKAGGVGCFHGSTTDKAIAAFSSPVHTRDEDEVRKITDELRTLSGRLAPREREELLGSLGRLVSAIRAGIDIGTEGTGRAGDAARTGADDGWKPIRVSRPGDLEEGGGVEPPRRAKRGKDQLSFDYELDPSQAGPAGEAAKRRAVDAVDSLRGTAGILALALSRDLAARQRTTLVGQTVAAPVDLAVLAQVYRDPRFETFRIFFVDGQDRVVSQIGLTQRLPGAVNAVMGDDAYEFANNLMVEARKKGATGFYMLHNHPSGQATPSGADESMTVSYAQQLMPTMKFHGHVVIDTNEFSVIDRNGRSQKHIRDFKQKAPLDRGDWEYWQIKGPNDAMNIAKAIEKDPNAVTLIMTNYQLQVHAVTTIPRASISSNKQATFKAVARATLRNTGSHVFAVSHDLDALLQVRGLVQDGIHISPNGRVSSLRETRPYGGNTPHHKASLRASRLSPDTSEEFNYLRPVIKSAAPTSRNVPKGATGTLFEPPRRSKVDDLGFFSQLERAVEGAPIKAAPAEQWKAWLAGNAAKMGVKAEEIQWSGVTDWLALQTGKVTKDAVVQYLAGNGVQVTETVRGVGSNEASWQLADKMEELGYRVEDDGGDDVFYFDPQGNSIGYEELPPELQRAVDQWGRDASPPTKYQSYTLPGGQNYRELLLTLDQKREKKPLETISIDEALARVRNGLPVAFEDDMSTATIDRTISLTDPNSYYLEQVNGGFGRLLAARVDIDGSLIGPDDGPSASRFESGHWNEPNVLAHIRYNERTDADGKRVLFIEEIQSDWAQAGRKSGFRSARPDTTGWTAEKQYDGTNGYSVWRVFKADGSTASNGVNAESACQAIEAIADRWAGSGVPNAPFVRDTNAWVALAVKRMIIEAARRDFDKIAFTTGEQNAERYDLSKHIDTISYAKADGGTVSVDAIKDGSNVFSKANMTMTEVEDTVGKEVAKKIADGGGEVNPRTGYTDLSGLDLKVGGDGMKAFYNQIVPGVVRDVLKKVGGGSMKVVTLPAIPGSKGNGWGSTDENMIGDPERSQPGFDITPAMREKVAGGLPRFSKSGSKAPLERDELGRFRFAYGRRLEDTVKALLDPILTRLALKMASPELRKKLRAMKAEIARAQETAVEVAESMKAMPTDQAEMISDIIEQELVAGTVPPAELVTIATRIGVAMEAQTNELVRLGMISQEAADRWRGRYLPRFYESKLSKRIDPWMQAVMQAIRRPKSMQGIRGNNLKARGLPLETIDVADLPSWLADGWEIRDENYRAGTSDRVTVWRDYTREEREEMGEIRDARFRFVMGYMAAQKDIALGRLFEKIAADTADTGSHPGWVKVPSTKVEETGVNRFGKLSGMWVPKEVFDHLAKYDDTGANHELLLMYRKALGLWKESKTVLNPTAHANNVFGNVTMAHFAGVSYWDVHKYAGTVRDLVKDAPMVREARDAGLFLSTMGKDEIVQALPESLRLLADMQESSLEKGGRRVWNALALWLRKPMGAAYAGEDLFFRYMIYREARGRGLEPGDAVNYAADFIFEYDDLPKGAMAIRDTFLPFFSWTYKAIPAMFTTVTNYPWRFAAPAVAMYAVNAAMYAVAFGEKDDDWWQKIGRYVTDSDFRDKVRAEEKSERANLPPWLKGNSFTLGLPKAIRLGMDELTQLPVFMDISRMFPAGDLLDANSNAGGVPWLQSLTPSNPVFTTLSAIFVNRDLWTGRDLVDKNDTSAEAATKRAEWVWKQFTPAIAFGNYQLDRMLDTVARAAGTEIPGMFRDHTGVGRDKLPVQPLYTIENTFGIKARPYDLEQSRQIGESQKRELIRSLEYEIKRTQRYVNAGVMSFSQASKQIETDKAKIQNLKQGLTLEGNEKD